MHLIAPLQTGRGQAAARVLKVEEEADVLARLKQAVQRRAHLLLCGSWGSGVGKALQIRPFRGLVV